MARPSAQPGMECAMPEPEMIQVQSSNVEAIGYDAGHSELYVRFTSGDTYVYLNVDRSLYDDLLSAPSVGRYLNINVKSSHGYRRL